MKKKRYSSFALIRGMLSLIGPYVWLIVLAVLLGTLGFFAAMGITFFSGLAIYDFINNGFSFSNGIAIYIVLVLVCGFARGFLRYAEQYLNHYMAFTLLAVVRDKIFAALTRQGSKVLDDKQRGEILSIIQSDVETMEVFYAHTITPFFIAIFVELGVFLSLFFLVGYEFALLALAADLIIGAIIPLIFFRSNKQLGKRYRELLSHSESLYLDAVYGVKEFVSYEKQEILLEEIAASSKKLNSLTRELNAKSAKFSSLTQAFIVIADIAIVALGGVLVHYGHLTSDAALSYAILAASFGPVVALAALPSNLTMSFASADRVLSIVNAPSPIKEGEKDFLFENLKMDHVSFAYEEKEILKDVSFDVKKGEIIGIKGKSGSGKSTILKLLLHFEEPVSGSVEYNGESVASYSRKAISDNVTLFSQSTYLFSGSFAYNLRLAKPEATEEELVDACKSAGILDYILSTPKGFDTEINAVKDNISSGEKQRLGLARVFLADTPLLLLDEATSNVDAYNEALILNELKKRKDKALIIVSHRDSTLSICDRVYLLENGITVK